MNDVSAVYDRVAASYAVALPDTAYEDPLDLAMIAHLVEGGPARMLDAGCGAGRMVPHLAALGVGEVVGVDASAGMIAEARRAHPQVAFSIAELAALPYPTGDFDAVLAWYSIIHTPTEELGATIAELVRVLRPGGRLLLGFQAGTGSRVIPRAYGHDVSLTAYLHEPARIAGMLEEAGGRATASLLRTARPAERHDQGFVAAERAAGR